MSEEMKFVLFIGAMKSGTTSLYQYLSQHPRLAPCKRGKEVDFFTDPELWERGIGWFREQWDWQPGQHRYALGGSTTYTMLPHRPNAADRIREVQGDFRFLYILRDPFTRIPSHFYHAKYQGDVSKTLSIDTGLRENPTLLDYTRYASQVEEYDRRFGRDRTHLVTLERLSDDPEEVVHEICDFLDIERYREFTNLRRKYNSQDDQVREGPLISVLQAIEPVKRVVRRAVPLSWRNLLKRKFGSSDPEVEYPELDRDAKHYIRNELSGEIKRLAEDDRVSIDHWQCRAFGGTGQKGT